MNVRRLALPVIAFVVCSGFFASPATAGPTSLSKCQRITKPGPYIVTKAITAAANAQYCFLIEIDNVTIDFDGYTITGQGTGQGVWDNQVSYRNITIRNGGVRNFHHGIYMDSEVTVEKMSVTDNVENGIALFSGRIVRDCVVGTNSGIGIYSNLTLVTQNVVTGNGIGIYVANSNIVGNVVRFNAQDDIVTASDSTRYNNNPAP